MSDEEVIGETVSRVCIPSMSLFLLSYGDNTLLLTRITDVIKNIYYKQRKYNK